MFAADVFEMVLAGRPAAITATAVNQLPPDERQEVLCTVCAMHDEIARNCVQTGTEVSTLLVAECPFYINGVATCLLK
jgi:hypothetical protein